MLFCENCRQRNSWPRSSGYPYTGLKENGKCEICRKTNVCHDVPALFLIPGLGKTQTEKILDKAIQLEYHQKADSLIIVYVSGGSAGQINHRETELLREIVVKKNEEIDWYATYYLRLRAQQGYQKIEEVRRDKRNYTL